MSKPKRYELTPEQWRRIGGCFRPVPATTASRLIWSCGTRVACELLEALRTAGVEATIGPYIRPVAAMLVEFDIVDCGASPFLNMRISSCCERHIDSMPPTAKGDIKALALLTELYNQFGVRLPEARCLRNR